MSLYDTGIRPKIDEYLESQAHQDYPDFWRGSSAGYCQRYVIMKRLMVTPVPERQEDQARSTRVFEAGHIFHEWLQRITKNAGLSMSSEAEITDARIGVIGHFDDLIMLQERDDKGQRIGQPRLILYDYKTANSMAFKYKREGIGDLHRMQLATYMFMLRQNGLPATALTGAGMDDREQLTKMIRNLTEARILQIEKDTLRMREQELIYTPELQREVVDYWQTLQTHWERYQQDGTLPNCTCHIPDDGWFSRRTKKGKIYNDFFYHDEPCSQTWFDEWKRTKAAEEAK